MADFWSRVTADSNRDGIRYLAPYTKLDDAIHDPNALLTMTADDGGTVMLTVPLALVDCSTGALRQLALDLDSIIWSNNDPTMVALYVEPAPADHSIPGGMGGGAVTEKLWLHPVFAGPALQRVQAVLQGIAPRLDTEGLGRNNDWRKQIPQG